MRDVSKYESVGEWYQDNRGRVPIQVAAALERVMSERGVTFPEAYAILVQEGRIIEIEPVESDSGPRSS